jgi:hypothetical protein
VFGVVLLALGGARRANVSAKPAEIQCECATAGHELRGEAANRRAISIEPNALPHHVDFRLTETGGRAVIALGGAGIAGVDAVCELLMAHGEPFLSGPTVLHTPFQDS